MNEKRLNNFRILSACLWGILLVIPLGRARASGPRMAVLQNHRSAVLRSASVIGAAPADEPVSLSFVVQADQTLLDRTFNDLYGSSAAEPKHFLTSGEFAQKFGLAEKRDRIKAYAASQGLTVDSTDDDPLSMSVRVSGKASTVESAFRIHLNHYRAADGRLFRAHDADPQIPAALLSDVGAVVGLSNLTGVARPHYRLRPLPPAAGARVPNAAASRPAGLTGGTGPGGALSPTDIKSIYSLNGTSLNGSGQSLALFELDGYTASDITQYELAFGLAPTSLVFIGVDGATNFPGTGAVEVTLDIELAIALAPGLSSIRLYTGPNSALGVYDTYNKIATDNISKAVSTSWGLDEEDNPPALLQAENQIFQRMAIQGQSMFAASGDCGAYDIQDGSGNCITTDGFHVDDPASQPYVTGVGGTSLSGTVSSPVETVWNEFGTSSEDGGGGGVSNVWPLPSYQSGVAGKASAQSRNVPDVALNADPDSSPYAIYFAGSWHGVGGTSAAAPLWAAMTALLNQQRAASGNSSFGFANTTLYQLGVSTSSSTVFHDVTVGNNVGFSAAAGYDNATGWGSFRGIPFISNTTNLNASAFSTLGNVFAYPNPWDTRKGFVPQVIIRSAAPGLPDGTSVKLFTLSGFWVKTLTAANGAALWDLTNDSGQRVASGLYFYLATFGSQQAKGTIAIIK